MVGRLTYACRSNAAEVCFHNAKWLAGMSAHYMYVMHVTSLSLCIAHYPVGEEVGVYIWHI